MRRCAEVEKCEVCVGEERDRKESRLRSVCLLFNGEVNKRPTLTLSCCNGNHARHGANCSGVRLSPTSPLEPIIVLKLSATPRLVLCDSK